MTYSNTIADKIGINYFDYQNAKNDIILNNDELYRLNKFKSKLTKICKDTDFINELDLILNFMIKNGKITYFKNSFSINYLSYKLYVTHDKEKLEFIFENIEKNNTKTVTFNRKNKSLVKIEKKNITDKNGIKDLIVKKNTIKNIYYDENYNVTLYDTYEENICESHHKDGTIDKNKSFFQEIITVLDNVFEVKLTNTNNKCNYYITMSHYSNCPYYEISPCEYKLLLSQNYTPEYVFNMVYKEYMLKHNKKNNYK